MISIGVVYRGPELRGSHVNLRLSALSKAVSDLRGPLTFGHVPLVNVIFIVPGSLGCADNEGLEYGRYLKKYKAVEVQVAVPKNFSLDEEIEKFLIYSLQGANAMAFEFFRRRGEIFPLRDAELLVAAADERVFGGGVTPMAGSKIN